MVSHGTQRSRPCIHYVFFLIHPATSLEELGIWPRTNDADAEVQFYKQHWGIPYDLLFKKHKVVRHNGPGVGLGHMPPSGFSGTTLPSNSVSQVEGVSDGVSKAVRNKPSQAPCDKAVQDKPGDASQIEEVPQEVLTLWCGFPAMLRQELRGILIRDDYFELLRTIFKHLEWEKRRAEDAGLEVPAVTIEVQVTNPGGTDVANPFLSSNSHGLGREVLLVSGHRGIGAASFWIHLAVSDVLYREDIVSLLYSCLASPSQAPNGHPEGAS